MRRRLRKADVRVGDKVTCIERVDAYYSNYGGNPECWFEPGEVGVVGAVDVPCTTYAYRKRGGTASFVCVDFEKHGQTWRCALYYNNVRRLKCRSPEVRPSRTPR